MRLRRRKSRGLAPEITLTPLIDTALTLLVIFMVTTPMMKNSLKISLPEVKNKTEKVSSQKQLEIFIDKNENIYVNSDAIKIENLKKHIENKLKQSTNKVVIVNGDRSVSYNTIIKTLDIINSIEGEKNVALVAKRIT